MDINRINNSFIIFSFLMLDICYRQQRYEMKMRNGRNSTTISSISRNLKFSVLAHAVEDISNEILETLLDMLNDDALWYVRIFMR